MRLLRMAGKLAVVTAAVLALASCAVRGQADPEPIPREEVPFDLKNPSTSSTTSTTSSTSGTPTG